MKEYTESFKVRDQKFPLCIEMFGKQYRYTRSSSYFSVIEHTVVPCINMFLVFEQI